MYKNNKEIEFTLEYGCKEGMWVFFFLLRGGLIDWMIVEMDVKSQHDKRTSNNFLVYNLLFSFRES